MSISGRTRPPAAPGGGSRRGKGWAKWKRRSKVGDPDEEGDADTVVYRFDIGFGKTLLIMALSTLFIFIPVAGPFILFTVAPFIAGYFGGKHVLKKDGLLIGLIVGSLWSVVQYIVFFHLVLVNFGLIGQLDFSGGLERAILALVFLANMFFCGLGGWKGGEPL